MDRPRISGFALLGLALIATASGCRSTRSSVPPAPSYGAAGGSGVQFSSEPAPGQTTIANANPSNAAMTLPGQGSPVTHGDVPSAGLGMPTSPASNPAAPAPADDPATAPTPGAPGGNRAPFSAGP